MKGILAALLLVLLAVLLAIVLTSKRAEEGLDQPVAEPAEFGHEPENDPKQEPPPTLLEVVEGDDAAPPSADPGIRISGRVVNGLGAPVSGAAVQPPGGDGDGTDADGRFELFVPEPGPVELRIRHRAYLNTTSTITAPTEDATVVLERGLTVTGQISFPDGMPVPGIGVQAGDHSAAASTEEDGRYELVGLAPGAVTVQCHAAGETRTVQAGAAEVNFTLNRHVVRLRYVDETGKPVLEGTLQVRGKIKGEFSFSRVGGLGSGGVDQLDRIRTGSNIEISVTSDGFAPLTTRFTIDGEPRFHEFEIVMLREGPRGTLDLRVLDDEGKPRTHAVVYLRTEGGSSVRRNGNQKIELDGDGRTRIEVPVGTYELKVLDEVEFSSLNGYALPNATQVVVTLGEILPVEVIVRTGGRLRFAVTDADGLSAAAGSVKLFDSEGKQVSTWFVRLVEGGWTTDLDEPGPVALERALPPGRYRLCLVREEVTVVNHEIDIVRGTVTEVELQLPRR